MNWFKDSIGFILEFIDTALDTDPWFETLELTESDMPEPGNATDSYLDILRKEA